jgi:hypothetical protein
METVTLPSQPDKPEKPEKQDNPMNGFYHRKKPIERVKRAVNSMNETISAIKDEKYYEDEIVEAYMLEKNMDDVFAELSDPK